MTLLSNELIENIYDASLDSTQWDAVLSNIADYYDASVCVLMCHNNFFPQNDIHVHVRNPHEIQQLYMQEYFLDGDIWYQVARRNWPKQSIIIGEEHISDTQLRKTAFYNDILKPADGGQQLSGPIENSPTATKAIAISRPFSGKRFCESDKQSMSELVAHLKRAFDIHEKLCMGANQNSLLDRLLGMTSTAAIVCSTEGNIVFSNTLADNILKQGDGLSVSQGILNCAKRTITEEMHAVLKSVRSMGSFIMNVDGLKEYGTYRLMFFPIDNNQHAFGVHNDLVGIFIHQASNDRNLDTTFMQTLFGLTRSESLVSGLIYSGLTPAQIAEGNKVKISTVRTQLHRIFDKTGTRNQAQLVRLMAETLIWHSQGTSGIN